jgi:hypothetical protein
MIMMEQRRRTIDRRNSLGRRMHSERRRRILSFDTEHRGKPDDRRGRVDRRLGNRAQMQYWFLSWLRSREES